MGAVYRPRPEFKPVRMVQISSRELRQQPPPPRGKLIMPRVLPLQPPWVSRR
jgi:hypothetical protein